MTLRLTSYLFFVPDLPATESFADVRTHGVASLEFLCFLQMRGHMLSGLREMSFYRTVTGLGKKLTVDHSTPPQETPKTPREKAPGSIRLLLGLGRPALASGPGSSVNGRSRPCRSQGLPRVQIRNQLRNGMGFLILTRGSNAAKPSRGRDPFPPAPGAGGLPSERHIDSRTLTPGDPRG